MSSLEPLKTSAEEKRTAFQDLIGEFQEATKVPKERKKNNQSTESKVRSTFLRSKTRSINQGWTEKNALEKAKELAEAMMTKYGMGGEEAEKIRTDLYKVGVRDSVDMKVPLPPLEDKKRLAKR